ncbi:hypothetical protein DERF_001775 [Dermatophagoides farinae]|uniref:Uncharacterized protein n=1 Tax=Dermatophagoides farinae TaxID=6954 RepID=A0A922IA50_DERFA|nr:hypothetical protein DERF_001775 [Dermatophagoides farinae]
MKSVHIQLHPSLLFMDDSSQKKIFHYKIYDNFSLSYLLWTILAILTIIITRPVHCIIYYFHKNINQLG